MRRHAGRFFLGVLLILGVVGTASAQLALRGTNVEALEQLSIEFRERYEREHAIAVDWAAQRGISMRQVTPDGREIELMYFRDGRPVYYTTDNMDAAISTSTDVCWVGQETGYDLSGDGVTLHQWDGGWVRLSHIEFQSQVNWADGTPDDTSSHSTHVAGTIVAEGFDAQAHGMAYDADLEAYDFDDDFNEISAAAAAGAICSNHSYGFIRGWDRRFFVPDSAVVWFWHGDSTISVTEDADFGYYCDSAREWDQVTYNAPFYLMVKSAGNDRGDSHNGGHYVWGAGSPSGSWIWSTAPRDDDGGDTGYDTVANKSCAKNILTVGAVRDVAGGYGSPGDVEMTNFSGWGPTDDGRIKPDICGNGWELYSCDIDSDNHYSTKNGTSMSSPNVTGSLALLIERYRNLNSSADMRSATLKALAIHTADECGDNDGPDYEFGWGLLNTRSAARHMGRNTEPPPMQELTLLDSETFEQSWNCCGDVPIKITVCWTDPPGTPVNPQVLDPTDAMLVNDLDVRLIGPGPTTHRPWILDPTDPDAAATRGDNFRDNVEVIYIEDPDPGEYTLRITHKGTLQGGSQDFALIISGAPSVYTVTPLGNGDFLTIQAAVDAVSACSIIELTDGTFTGPGNRIINPNGKDLWIRSESGDPQACIIDCQNVTRGFRFKSGETERMIVEGLTIKNGWNPESGGGISVYFESNPTIRNCIFLDCDAGESGGGMSVGWSSHPTVTNCTFHDNGAVIHGSGIHAWWYSDFTIENTVITDGRTQEAFWCDALSIPDAGCCNFYNNAGGDWTGNVASLADQNDNMSEEPLYCDAPNDLSLCVDSPCLFSSGNCAPFVGALPAGCDSCGTYVCCVYGDCQTLDDRADCLSQGGSWHPQYTSCDSNPCPQPPTGVCCTGEDCTVVIEIDCAGIWYPSMSTCDPNPCWLRACCIGEDCTITIETDCTGDWDLSEDSCDPNPCIEPESAVCCVAGQCVIATEDLCIESYEGTWYPQWVACDPDPCRLRACCVDEVCTITMESECEGIWHPNELTCEYDPCDEAACCLGDACQILTEEACTDAGGIWHSAWETCDGDPCKRAACCVNTVCTITVEDDCTGTWLSDEPQCDPNPCAAACCTDAVCEVKTEADCVDGGGIWHSEWLTCAGDPCPAVCCHTGTCEILTQSQCDGFSGTWHPEGTSCNPNPCFHIVKPDGTGDFPTIQAAINAVGHDEVIALTNGVFDVATHQGTETQGINFKGKRITVFSLSGDRDECIVDADSSGRAFMFNSGESSSSILRGVTIKDGVNSHGAGIRCIGSSPLINDCVFLNNSADLRGGGLLCGASSTPSITDCVFTGNNAGNEGGGICSDSNSHPWLSGCIFTGNTAGQSGGGLCGGTPSIPAGGEMTGCTFYGNSAMAGGAIYMHTGSTASVNRTLIAFGTGGGAVDSDDPPSAPSFWCSDIYGNEGGDWVGFIAGQLGMNSNISEDPRFCDPPENLSLCIDSSCLPENSPCGQSIGALGLGCTWCGTSSDLDDGVLIAHHPPGLIFSTGQDWGQRYYDEFSIDGCEDQNNRIDASGDTARVWYILAAWTEEKTWCSTEFGLGNYSDLGLTIIDHGPCFPDNGTSSSTIDWPGPNEGIVLDIDDTSWTGNFSPVYWFAGTSDGTVGMIPLDVHPESGFAGTVSCAFPPRSSSAICLGGIGFLMDGTYCCPFPADSNACCVDGVCSLLTEEDCGTAGGTWYSGLGTCDPSPCTGVCCLSGGCMITTTAECSGMAGDWHGNWESCDPNPCTAACCISGGCSVTTEASCTASGGDWIMGLDDCTPNPCPGVCCVGGSCEVIASGDCSSAGGVWYSHLDSCDPNPCAAVCCVGNVCSILSEAACETADGEWHPDLTACDPNPCPAACCIGEACVLLSQTECAGEGGTWYSDLASCTPNPCLELLDWADHDVGDCILSVTDKGTVGFMDGTQSEGSGFIYPSDGENQLFLGSIWLGVDSTYVANNDFDADPAKEWTVSVVPDGHIWIDENGTSMQDIHAAYTDSAAVDPVGLYVDQESWAFTVNEATTDFVIIRYTFENVGAGTLGDLYAGLFMDFDMQTPSTQNTGGTVDSLDLVYMTGSSGVHAGVRYLQDTGDVPESNRTLIYHPTYVWPNSYLLDADKWGFLTAADSAHVLTEPDTLSDYSVLAAAGPFDLAPSEQRLIAFAVVGGEDLADLMQNAHVAHMIYTGSFLDVPVEPDLPIRLTCLGACTPNPFHEETIIRFELVSASYVTLSVFDVNGSLVQRIADATFDAGRHRLIWDGRTLSGRKAPAGVYFVDFTAGKLREGRRLILLR